MDIGSLSPFQLLILIGCAILAVGVVIGAVRAIVRLGKLTLKVGCVVVVLLIVLVSCVVGVLMLG
jgi:hypothetical protein